MEQNQLDAMITEIDTLVSQETSEKLRRSMLDLKSEASLLKDKAQSIKFDSANLLNELKADAAQLRADKFQNKADTAQANADNRQFGNYQSNDDAAQDRAYEAHDRVEKTQRKR